MDGFTAFLLNGKQSPDVIEFVVRCYGDTRTEMEAKALEEAHRWNEDDDCVVEVHPAYEVWEVSDETKDAKYWASITILISEDVDEPITTEEEWTKPSITDWLNNNPDTADNQRRMPITLNEGMDVENAMDATRRFYGRHG